MNCCCPHARSASKCFSFFARRYRKRFERRGFEPSQRQLLRGLEQLGYQDATLLEIGSGVGYLHQHLLEQGAKSAFGVDLAPAMITEARAWAQQRGLAARTEYLVGDFMALAPQLPAAEITLLDKVICCYPDAQGMVRQSLAKTERLYALSYPRRRWLTRVGAALTGLLMWLLRSDFRVYVHDPAAIEEWITRAGFGKCYEASTTLWLTQVYQRTTASGDHSRFAGAPCATPVQTGAKE